MNKLLNSPGGLEAKRVVKLLIYHFMKWQQLKLHNFIIWRWFECLNSVWDSESFTPE